MIAGRNLGLPLPDRLPPGQNDKATETDFSDGISGAKIWQVSACACRNRMILAYIGWTAAQFVASGLILNTLTGVDKVTGIMAVLVVPTLLAIWWPRANRYGAVAVMIAGYMVWIGLPLPVPDTSPDFVAFLVGLVVMVVVTPLTQKIDPPNPVTNIDGEIEPLMDRPGLLATRP